MMSNLLLVPPRKTFAANIPQSLRSYLQDKESRNPAQFHDDIQRWSHLRQCALPDSDPAVHVNRLDPLLKYHAQLLVILSKLPIDIGLDIAYTTAFSSSVYPITLRNLEYERSSIVFNLASLYSQLGAAEDRSQIQGIRRVIVFFQNAAGTFQYLHDNALPILAQSLAGEEDQKPPDLTQTFVKPLQLLCLAQSQECIWQIAKLENRKNAILAKLAQSTSNFYKSSHGQCMDPSIRHLFPPEFLSHIEAKGYHFAAVAQYRKSIEESERNSYGIELARLTDACTSAKKAYDIARRGKVLPSVAQDTGKLYEILGKEVARAERDNDLIYLHDVPSPSTLPEIVPANLATSTIPKGLTDPNSLVPQPLFSGLVGWATRKAINIYNDRKNKIVEDNIVKATQEQYHHALRELQIRHLPSSLDARQKSVGLPPSIIGKAEEIRSDNGPVKITRSIEDVKALAASARDILDQTMDILDEEATEDESFRTSSLENSVARPPSKEANKEYIAKAERYRDILDEATNGDQLVREEWDDWSEKIHLLIQDESDIEKTIPSSGYSPSTSNPETRVAAQELRACLEELDKVHEANEDLVRRARSLCESDDIEVKVLNAASGLEKMTTLRPELFEEMSDEELAKYDKYLTQVRRNDGKQQEILGKISTLHEKFLHSRKEDPAIQERESALQSLDYAYHEYKEIVGNLEQGYKFYNELSQLLSGFKDSCDGFYRNRSREIELLADRLKTSLEIAPPPGAAVSSPFGDGLQLAPPGSGSWEEMVIPPGPSRGTKRR